MDNHRVLAVLFTAFALVVGCGEFDSPAVGGTSVSGEVRQLPFDGFGGTAEQQGDQYVVTIADDSQFSCTSSPVGNYLTVVISGIESEGTFSAVGNVSFNNNDGQIQNSEPAMSGTVVVDRIDDDDVLNRRIEGRIDASGPTSEVSGPFSVGICS